MATGGQIRYNVGFNIDKTGLNELTKTLQNVQQELNKTNNTDVDGSLKDGVRAAQQLESILNDAWNSKLNQLDLNKVNTGIKSTFGSVQQLKNEMEKGGATGSAAYNKIASSILNTNLQLKQSNKLLDDMADTMAKTVKWGITSSIFNRITGSIQEAWGYTKRLDNSLNDIRIVTEKSAEAMQQFAREANNAAKSLGASTTDYTEASLIYFQQGLSDEEVAARAQTTIKAANVTGQSAEEVSEQLTAVWNGYKASAQEAELYVDKLAAVAASTAADLEELSTGMSKVASAANSMGVDIDQLNAQLATIVSVTRQAPESVGTALKTIYARLGDLAVDGEDEFGVALGTVSKTMEEMGIQILDEQGQMREMGEVIEETAAKWNTWTEAQRQAAAVAIAGKRQYNNLVALFENWDMYTDALNTSVDATGTLQKQQDIYMESMEAHLQELSTEAERTYDILFNEEVLKDFTDAITGVLTIFNDFIEGIGGGGNALVYFGTIAANVFNKQIAAGIQKSAQNFQAWQANLKGGALKEEFIKTGVAKDNSMSENQISEVKALEAQYEIAGDMLKVQKGLSIEQQQQYINIQRQVGANTQQINLIQNHKEIAEKILGIENATLLNAQAREKDYKQALSDYQEVNAIYKNNLMLIEREGKTWENKKALITSIADISKTMLFNEQENLIIKQAKNEILTKGTIETATRAQLEEIINTKLKIQKQDHNEIVNLVKLMEAYENGEISALELQNQLLLQQKDILDDSGKNSLKLQKGIKYSMVAAQGLTALLGSLPSILDKTADKSSKVQASFSATSGIISAIGSAFGPVGMAIGMVGSSLVSAIGSSVVKGIEEQEEKIKKVKEDWQNLAGDISSTNQNIGSLNSIAKEFEYLSTGVSQYGENVSLTADEYERYQDLINEIVGISPDLVEGYTNEGQAIVNNNGLIERTIKLLKEEQLARKQALFTPDNIKTMAGEAEKEYNKAKGLLNDLQNDFSANALFTSAELTADVPKNLNLAALGGEIEFNSSEAADQFMADRKELMDLFYDTSIIPETGEVYYSNVNSNKILENREEIYKKLQEMQSKYDISDESIFGKGGSFETVEEFYAFTGDPFNIEEFNKKYENVKADIEEKTKGFNSQVITWMEAFNGSYQDMSAEQQLLIQNYINSFTTETFDKETFNTFTENATKFTNLFTKLDEDTQNELLKLSDPSNYDTYKDYLNGLWSFIKESGLDEEQLQDVAASLDISDMYLNENNQPVVIDDTIAKIHNLNDQIKKKIDDEDFDLAEYFSFSEIESGDITNMAGIDLTKITSIDDFIAKLNVIRESNTTKELQKSFENIKLSIVEIDGALNEFNDNGEISVETIEKLEKKYSQLREIQNKNSHEYIQTLREIREKEENNAKEALEGKIESLSNQAKFYIDVDTEKFDSVMKELISTKYQLQVEINADLASDIENGFGLAEEFETLRGYITDDLKISFEQAQDFIAKGYGDILTYAQETNEGVIQLNADQVKSFILGKKAELEVDKESKIEQLTRQREMLTSQLEILETQLAAYTAASVSGDEIDRTRYINEGIRAEQSYQNEVNLLNEELKKDDEQKIELSDNANKFYGVLSSIYQKDAENSMTADQEADAATKQYQKNVIEYYRAMHTAVSQYADAVKAAPAGKKVDFSATAMVGDFINTEVKGIESPNQDYESGVTELLAIEDLFNNEWSSFGEEDQQDIAKKLATDTQKRIDTLKSQIGSIDSAIAALKTSGSTFDETYSGIGTKTEKNNEKNRDTVEILEDVYDRYREINIILSTLETNLGRVQKQQEKLAGKSYTENLQQQLDLLNQQIEANREKIKIAQTEEAELMAVLTNQGANFNEAGQVTNYKSLMEQKLAETNAIINTYNSMSAEEQETYKATMEAAQKSYEALDETFQRFDELYTDEIPGLVDTIQEELDQAIELKIEQFNTKIQIDLDLKDAERQWNDFYAEIVKGLKEDDLVGQSELSVTQLGTYASKDGNDSSLTLNKDLEKLAFLNSQANQIISGGWSDTYGDNIAALLEDLNKANDQLITDMTAAKELADGVYDNYLTSIDKVIEGNDDVIGQFEFLGELLDHNQKLIGILGANNKASDLTGYYAEKNNLNQQMIAQHAENAKYYQQMMDSIGDKTSEEWQKWSEAWQEEVSNLNAAIIQGMEDAAAAYANAIELTMQEMESAFTDGLGFEYIQDEWDSTNENAEKYLDTINSAYEISKLENKFIDAINNTSSLSAQKKLTAAMREEIKLLENADKISQYDIDRANLKYELTLKQIALEEAQANKTSMRLQRDSQGNYGYVFAADQDEIAKAQEELANAENELYNFDKEAYNKKIESVLKAEQDLQSKLQEIWTNESLSEEQKLQYATMINEQYRNIIEADVAESEKMKENLANTTHTLLLKTFNEEVSQAINTGLELDRAAEQTVISMNEKFKGLINPEDPNSTVGSIAATLTEWSKATGQMVQNAGSTAVSLNSTFDNSFTSISASVNKISDAWGAADNPNSFAGRLSVQALNLVGNLQSTFNTGISAITSKIAKGDKGDGTSLEEIFSNSMLSCQNASLAFQRTVEEVARQAGIALGNAEMGGGIYGSVSSVKEIMRLLTEQTNEYSNRVTGENGALVAAQNLSTKYEIQHDKMSKLNSAMLSYNTYLTNMANKAAEATKQANALTEALNKQYEAQKKANSQSSGVGDAGSTAAPQESYSGGGDSYTPPEPPPAPEPQTYTVQKGDTLWDITGGDWNKINAIAAANGITDPNKIYTGENLIIPYDTGGYTGDWHSSQGKIAMLHEKEIVLNKADTANILDVVSMVREMTSSSLRGANGMVSGILDALASVTNNSSNSRQEVYITAEFPNATSVADIEEAFRSLPNIASQYAFSY